MKKHQNKKIRIAIEYALKKGWVFSESGKSGHSFGQLKCPYNDSECRCGKYCQFGIGQRQGILKTMLNKL